MSFRRLMLRGLVANAMLLATGLVRAEETSQSILTALSSTTISGYVDTSAAFWGGAQSLPGIAPIPEPSTTLLLVAGVFGCWLARGFRSRIRKA